MKPGGKYLPGFLRLSNKAVALCFCPINTPFHSPESTIMEKCGTQPAHIRVINRRLNAPPLSLLQSYALKQKAKMDYCLLDRFNHIKLEHKHSCGRTPRKFLKQTYRRGGRGNVNIGQTSG